ncbi:MAG: class I SAM-dependent methyltransferase [Actinomycetota bacterium]
MNNIDTNRTSGLDPATTDFDRFIVDFSPEYAEQYTTRRPGYPDELIDWMAGLAPARDHVWDAGTGTGQFAVPLGSHFDRVTASDSNQDMLANATRHPNVTYHHWPSEVPELPDRSVDLITAGMAVHWFDADVFNPEARRVLRPDGALAAFAFYFFEIDHGIGSLVKEWYEDSMTGYEWPQLTVLRQGYQNFELPFEPIEVPAFTMNESWTFHQMAWFLHSWIVVKRARTAGVDALSELLPQVADRWPGGPDTRTSVRWPLFGRASRLVG